MDEGVGAVEDSLKGLLSLRKLCILISVFGTAIAYGLQGNAYLFSGCERQLHSMRPGDSMNLWEGHERPGTQKEGKIGSPRALIRFLLFCCCRCCFWWASLLRCIVVNGTVGIVESIGNSSEVGLATALGSGGQVRANPSRNSRNRACAGVLECTEDCGNKVQPWVHYFKAPRSSMCPDWPTILKPGPRLCSSGASSQGMHACERWVPQRIAMSGLLIRARRKRIRESSSEVWSPVYFSILLRKRGR